jgi:hypothetical protein
MTYIVSNIATKVLKRDSDDESLTFSIKADVTNKTDDSEVYVRLQGLDSEGFEVYSVSLDGSIQRNATKTLTTKESYVDFSDFDQIVSWQFAG